MGVGVLIRNVITTDQKAAPLGVATLDSNTKVPKAQINGVLSASDVGAIATGGTAATANQLTTARTIAATGDASYSVSFDGSANVSGAITLANSGVTAGTYNALATQVRPFTVNGKGLITGVSAAVDITPPWSAITGKPTTLSGYGISDALPLSGGTVTGVTTFSNTTASTSTVTGGVVFGGGIGVAGNANIGGDINGVKVGIGVDNTSIKIGALAGNVSTGANFVAIGASAGVLNTSGTNCVAVGSGSAFSNITGGGWTAIGINAGRFATGSTWVAVGAHSAFGIQSSANWTSIGANAGRFLADGIATLTSSANSCYMGAFTKGTNSSTNENVFGYSATGNGSNTVTIGDNNIIRTYLKGVVDVANTTASTSPTTGASVVAGGQGIGGNQHVAGFTSLGGTAGGHPAIKMKVIEGTTANVQGGVVSVAHGITYSKITFITACINSDNLYLVPPSYFMAPGYEYGLYANNTHINIGLKELNSEYILSQPFIVTIFYKE